MFPLFATGVIDTGGKFSTCVVDTGGNLPLVSTTPAIQVAISRCCRCYRWQIYSTSKSHAFKTYCDVHRHLGGHQSAVLAIFGKMNYPFKIFSTICIHKRGKAEKHKNMLSFRAFILQMYIIHTGQNKQFIWRIFLTAISKSSMLHPSGSAIDN